MTYTMENGKVVLITANPETVYQITRRNLTQKVQVFKDKNLILVTHDQETACLLAHKNHSVIDTSRWRISQTLGIDDGQ